MVIFQLLFILTLNSAGLKYKKKYNTWKKSYRRCMIMELMYVFKSIKEISCGRRQVRFYRGGEADLNLKSLSFINNKKIGFFFFFWKIRDQGANRRDKALNWTKGCFLLFGKVPWFEFLLFHLLIGFLIYKIGMIIIFLSGEKIWRLNELI